MGLTVGSEYKPFFTITTSNDNITNLMSLFLESFVVNETIDDESDRLSLVISRPSTMAMPKLGEDLNFSIGFQAYQVQKGHFIVSDISLNGSPAQIGITANSTPFSDRKQAVAIQSQKSRTFEQTKLGDIIKTIAADNKLTPKISDKFNRIMISNIIQMDESDLNFCSRLAYRFCALFKIANDSLIFIEKNTGETAEGLPIPPVHLSPDLVSSWRVTFGSRFAAKTVKAKYKNNALGLTQTFQLGSGDPVVLLPFTYANETDAKNAAISRQQDSLSDDNTLEITLPVIIQVLVLNAGGKIVLSGFDPAVDREWIVRTLEYSYSSAGFTLRIVAVNQLFN